MDMKLETYELEMDESGRVFEFVSNGPKGSIRKRVVYSQMYKNGIFNLGFGDINLTTNQFDDHSRSDNGDAEKVLATVVQTVLVFTMFRPKAIIYAKGSTPARTRMYQMGVSKYLESISEHFQVYGLINGEWEPFRKARRYEAFLAERMRFEEGFANK
jgi:hypothetical protein